MGNSLAKAIKAKNDAQFRLNIRDRAPSINEGSGGGTVIVDPNNYTVPYTPGKNISFGVAGDQKVINAIMNLLKGDNISISAPDVNGAVTITGTLGGKPLDITNLVDGYVITYDAASGKFMLSEIPSSYQLPQATETILGGIKAKAKVGETSEIAIDPLTGKLYGPAPDAAANGLPPGGTSGQLLKKIDGINYNADWTDVPESGGGITIVTQLPATPTDGQTVMFYNAGFQYMATYYAATGLWYKTTLVGSNYPWTNLYKPSALFDLLLGDATKSIVAVTISTDFVTALRIKGAMNTTKQLEWTFTSGVGTFGIWLGDEGEGGYDYGRVFIDNIDLVDKITTVESRYITKILTAGTHVLKITYTKDSNGDVGYDGVQIYAINVP